MTTRSSSGSPRATRARSISPGDLESWTAVDPAAIANGQARQRYLRLQRAIELYVHDSDHQVVLETARVSARWFYRLLQRCMTRDRDGRLLGWRALVWRECDGPRVRTKPRDAQINGPQSGFSGLFGKLLRDHPSIERNLTGALARQGSRRLMPNRLNFRGVHRAFIAACVAEGIESTEYPLNTQSQARRPLKLWLDNVFLPAHASRWLSHEVSASAAQATNFGHGNGQDTRLEEPYVWWQIDESTVDVLANYEIQNETGDWDEIALDRFMLIHVVAMGTSASLAWSLVLARQVNAGDLVTVLWQALDGQPKAAQPIPNLDYRPGAGYPSVVHPELRYMVPSVVYLDNALAHLAAPLQELIAVHFGAVVRVGRPGTPQERATVEANIKLLASQLLRQLPGATGSSPGHGVRDRTERAGAQRLVVRELEQSIDTYLANRNSLPNTACRGISPLERLGRQLHAGTIQGAQLPAASRKPHLFSSSQLATVRMNHKTGRRPHINFEGVRYTSARLGNAYGLVGRRLVVRCDPRDLRVIWLYEPDNGAEFGPVSAVGRWGKFPHDLRIRKLFLKLKRQAELGEHAEDQPLEALYQYLRDRAPSDRRSATRLAYVLRFLEGAATPIDILHHQASTEWQRATASANEPLPIEPDRTVAPSLRSALEPEPPTSVVLSFPSSARRRFVR